jgi:hypothetical protein
MERWGDLAYFGVVIKVWKWTEGDKESKLGKGSWKGGLDLNISVAWTNRQSGCPN